MARFGAKLACVRADRLVAVLLLLQARGRVTAEEVASELEVSIRTARRDLEALAMAGIPVYSQPGRGGGWSLVGGARTDLTGLTAAEARTLFLIAGPSSAATPEAKAALRKLVQALPETFRAEAEKAASAVVLDAASWGRRAPRTPPFLGALQQAVIRGEQVRLAYTDAAGVETDRTVHPLGLVAKGTTWYLLADTDSGLRSFRVWRVRDVEPTGDPARRPDGFDLDAAWREIVDRIDGAAAVVVQLLARGDVIRWLRLHFGARAAVFGERDGRVEVEVSFSPSHDDPARELVPFGDAVEVVEPREVRARLRQIGESLARLYAADVEPS